jgi:hypothetical protein
LGGAAGITKNFPCLFPKSQWHCANFVSGVNFPSRRAGMYFVAGALAVLSGLFYAADHHEIGSLGVTMCRYGGTFCDNPSYVFVGAILAALWGTFVSVR